MRSAITLALCALTISACDNASTAMAAQEAGEADETEITVPEVTLTRKAPVADQLLTCVQSKDNGITLTQFFLVHEGQVKAYSRMQNRAGDMCSAGQPDCALGWQGEKIALYSKTASGAVNAMTVDVDSLAFDKTLVTASRGTERYSGTCTSEPLPEGITIE